MLIHEPTAGNDGRPRRSLWSLALSLAIAVGIWRLFMPGVLSVDSFYFVMQVTYRQFTDNHGLVIPFVLAGVTAIGGDISWLTLSQSVAGMLGLRRLILAIGDFASVGRRRQEWVAAIEMGLIVSPLTPFSIHLVTLWTDTWLAICMLWVAALALEMHTELRAGVGVGKHGARLAGIALLFGFALLVRPNAIAIYPAFLSMLLLGGLAAGVRRSSLLAGAVAPLAMHLFVLPIPALSASIERTHPEHAVFALDLASMYLDEPSLCSSETSPSTCRLVMGVFDPGFVVGDGAIDRTFNQGEWRVYPQFLALVHYPFLTADYFAAIRRAPSVWARVKVLNFLDYLRPDVRRYFFAQKLPNNDFGISYRPKKSAMRSAWFELTHLVSMHPLLRWFSFVHAVWLAVAALAFTACIWGRAFVRRSDAGFLAALLLIPLSYYASYLLALTASDFRFMYPATLIVQVLALSLAASCLVRFATNGRHARAAWGRRASASSTRGEPEPVGFLAR